VQCVSDRSLGDSMLLIKLGDFPSEFLFLIDYFRLALSFENVAFKKFNYKVVFNKLDWETQLRIVTHVKEIQRDLGNEMTMRDLNKVKDSRFKPVDLSHVEVGSKGLTVVKINY
jgi:hypothetical protein